MPTTNPVPSTDPSDLLFNAAKLDEVVSGSSQYYTDRRGVNRRTLAGISAAADVVLGGLGYAPPVTYASGISMTLTTQTVEYSGEIYAPKVASLPFTTSTWATDSAKFRLIQGVAATDLAASGGAEMIGYMPAGTGAVATTVQAKMRETVSVKDFGAVGDGVTDDTAAIQAAINFVHTGQSDFTRPIVYLPAGTYKTTSELYIEAKPIRLLGDGATIKNSASNCLRIGKYTNPGPEYSVPAVIEGIVFYGFTAGVSYTGQSAYKGIVVEDCSGAVFRDCCVWGFNVGVYNYGGLVLTFDNVQLRTNIVAFQGVTGTFSLSNFINFLNCKLYENKIIIEGNGGSYSFKNIDAESNNPTGIAGVTLWNFTNLSGIAGVYCLEMDNVHCEQNIAQKEMYLHFAASDKAAKITCCNLMANATSYNIHIANGILDLDQSCVFNAATNGLYIDSGATVKSRSSKISSVGGSKTNYFVEHATGIQVGDTAGSYYKTGGVDATFEAYSPINGRWGQSKGDMLDYRWLDSAGNRIGYSRVVNSGEAFDFFDAGKVTSYQLYLDGAGQHQTTTAAFLPGADNAKTLGSGALRWSTVYAATGTINTSDARTKQQTRDLSDAERATARRCKSLLKAFKFNDAVEQKADDARWHFGVIAQEVKAAFEAEGLSAEAYALFCYDEWPEEQEVKDDEGVVLIPYRAAGNRYGVRYEELLAFIIAAL